MADQEYITAATSLPFQTPYNLKKYFTKNLRNRIVAYIFATDQFLNKMVEVFKTNVQKKAQSKMLLSILANAFPSFRINFDLSDRDKILRVEGDNIEALPIMMLVKEYGFTCDSLD